MPKRASQSHCLGVEKMQNSARTFFGSHTIRKNWHSSAHALAAHMGRSSFGDRNQNPYSRSSPGPRPSSKFLPRKAASKIKKRYRYGFSAQSIFWPVFWKFLPSLRSFQNSKYMGRDGKPNIRGHYFFCDSQIWTAGAKFHGTLARASRLAPGPLHFSLWFKIVNFMELKIKFVQILCARR